MLTHIPLAVQASEIVPFIPTYLRSKSAGQNILAARPAERYNIMCLVIVLTCSFVPVQVPLVIFKREKEIARQLEFEGLYIVDQPSDDDVRAHWDKLVLSTASFPQSYWDKFVKKKVCLLLLDGWIERYVDSWWVGG